MVTTKAAILFAAIVIRRSAPNPPTAFAFPLTPRPQLTTMTMTTTTTTTTTTILRVVVAAEEEDEEEKDEGDARSPTAPSSSPASRSPTTSTSSSSSSSSSSNFPRRDVFHRAASAIAMGALATASSSSSSSSATGGDIISLGCGCRPTSSRRIYDYRPRCSCLDRFFSYSMSTGMIMYENAAMPHKSRLFRTLFDSLSSIPDIDDDDRIRPVSILEVGIGTFPNAPYYAAATVSSGVGVGVGATTTTTRSRGLDIVGVDPNDFMFDYARDSAVRAGLISPSMLMTSSSSGADPPDGHAGVSLRMVHGVAESLPFASGSIDVVVSTLTLCSVVDQRRALSEVRRVLRPGTGRYVFWEHVLSEDDAGLAFVQRTLSPLQTIVADGCHLDRRTGDNIMDAGFPGGVEMEYATLAFDVPGGGIIGPTVFGIATA